MVNDSDAFDEFLGEEVVDAQGNQIGTLACYWENEAGQPVLIGIDLEGISGTRVAPAKNVQLDARKSYVVLPLSKTRIHRAPCLECSSELDRAFENKVFSYYGESSTDEEKRTHRTPPKTIPAEHPTKRAAQSDPSKD